MPKRTTLTFTSDESKANVGDTLLVYYCKYSGRHALTIDCELTRLPRRRTDGARIVKLDEHQIKLYTTDGGMKLIKREKDGSIERQYRLNIGRLPIAYKFDPESNLLYIMDNAVSTVLRDFSAAGGGDKLLVPPCIASNEQGQTQVKIEVEDRAHRAAIVRISADNVRIHTTINTTHDGSSEEILDLFSKILNIRIGCLQLAKSSRAGASRKKILVIDGITPQEAFEKMQEALTIETEKRATKD